MPTPPASVCIPVHRPAAHHLAAAIASVRAQEVELELLVSTDEVDEPLVRELADTMADAALRVLVQPRGLGMVEHWRAVVAAAEGHVVVVPGQDDLLRPAMLRRHLAEHQDRGVVLVASGAALVDDGGSPVGPRRRRVRGRSALMADRPRRRMAHGELVEVVLQCGNVVGAPSQVSFRRDAYEEVGGFSPRYEHAADVDLWLRLATCGDAVLLAEQLGTRRAHGAAATLVHRRDGAAARDRRRLVEDHGAALDPAGAAVAAVARTRWEAADAMRAARRGDVGAAVRHLGHAGRSAPRGAGAWRRYLGGARRATHVRGGAAPASHSDGRAARH